MNPDPNSAEPPVEKDKTFLQKLKQEPLILLKSGSSVGNGASHGFWVVLRTGRAVLEVDDSPTWYNLKQGTACWIKTTAKPLATLSVNDIKP